MAKSGASIRDIVEKEGPSQAPSQETSHNDINQISPVGVKMRNMSNLSMNVKFGIDSTLIDGRPIS